MQRNTWGGIKFSRYWERHCDGHKPPGPLLGACTQLRRCCRRKKTPGKTWPNWLQDLDVSRNNVGCGTAAAAGLLGSEVLKSNRQGQAGCLEVTLFSRGKRSIISLGELHQPLSSSALGNGGYEHGRATWKRLGGGIMVGVLCEPSSITSGVLLPLLGFVLPRRS